MQFLLIPTDRRGKPWSSGPLASLVCIHLVVGVIRCLLFLQSRWRISRLALVPCTEAFLLLYLILMKFFYFWFVSLHWLLNTRGCAGGSVLCLLQWSFPSGFFSFPFSAFENTASWTADVIPADLIRIVPASLGLPCTEGSVLCLWLQLWSFPHSVWLSVLLLCPELPAFTGWFWCTRLQSEHDAFCFCRIVAVRPRLPAQKVQLLPSLLDSGTVHSTAERTG